MIYWEDHVLAKNNWPRIVLVQWYLDFTVKAAVTNIPIQGSASSTYVSCRLKVRIRFPNTWWILSIIAFACGFPEEAGLVLIPYSCYINLCLNLWPRSSPPPRSYMISTGYGYWTSHAVSTKFAIVIAFLSLYCVTSNHPVTGYIIVTAFKIKGSLPFLYIV